MTSSTQPSTTAALLGHPIRWQLLRALAQTDLRVSELVAEVGASQSLVSYHLALLRSGGVVADRRSAADSRDVYHRLDREALAKRLDELGAALHPLLGAHSPAAGRASGCVLFLCTANSARSQMAEAMLRQATEGRVTAISAGSRPQRVDDLALRVLGERGFETAGLRSKHWSEVPAGEVDRVITLCDVVREELPTQLGRKPHAHWSIPDPAALNGPAKRRLAAFRAAADDIQVRVNGLVAELAATRAA